MLSNSFCVEISETNGYVDVILRLKFFSVLKH